MQSQAHKVTTSQDGLNTEYSYKRLVVWKKADELAFEVYQTTKSFPNDERYGITSQIRRSALSVCLNLVEGCGRQGRKELKQYVNIALGSLAETDYLLDFSLRLNYLTNADHEKLQNLRKQAGALLWNFYKSLT
jgi:four helix bundle protein